MSIGCDGLMRRLSRRPPEWDFENPCLVEYQVFDAVFGFHIFNLAGKHHLIRFADLSHNIDELIFVGF